MLFRSIGGRYKGLWRVAREAREKRKETQPSVEEFRYLENAIETYSRGMELDYNQYFCACNLPLLLRARGDDGDVDRAIIVDHFVVAACNRAIKRGEDDEWTRPTLLGAAFRAGDVKWATELAKLIKLEGPARWKLSATLTDLSESIRQAADADKQGKLQKVYDDLARLLPPKQE